MCPVQRETEGYAHISKCSDKQRLGRDGLKCDVSRKWLNVTGEVTYRSVVQNTLELRSVREFLYNVGCKFENKFTNIVLVMQEEDKENYSSSIVNRSLYYLVCQ
jgi:hypothetical protein